MFGPQRYSLRPVVYGFGLALASFGVLLMFADSAQAAETPSTSFDATLATWGKTLILDDGAKAGIFPTALPGPADVQWTVSEEALPDLPSGRTVLGSVYRLTMSGLTELNPAISRPLAVGLPAGTSYWVRQIWQYDRTAKQWSPLSSRLNRKTNFLQAPSQTLDALYAVVEDRSQEEGIASWYCRRRCSPRYPTYHATSNDFPIGSTVKVRSLENGRSVNVKIVSRWGQPAGRIIDLSYPAYAALRPKNLGLTRVSVKPVVSAAPKAASATAGPPVDKTETLPTLRVSADGQPAPEAVQAVAYAVYDQTSDTLLAGRGADDARPIASITKLMTVMVFLDTGTPLRKVVSYSSANNASCSCLQVRSGETLAVRDLFYATLVGSANNAANALVESTGLSRPEFVVRMNSKAASLGLSRTTFTDPTGLDAGNVSTAGEVARLAAYALHNYEPIRYATTRRSYSFSTLNTQRRHTIYLRYSMFGRELPSSDLQITGGKTGYLDEARFTYVLRVKNDQGAQVVTVVLGSPSNVQRLNDLSALLDWTFSHHTWA